MSKLSYKSLFIIFFFLLVGVVILSRFILPNKTVSASWWNESWSYRKAIVINNSSSNIINQYVKITLDTATLISSNKMQNTCNDIRVTDINGNLLNHFIDGNTNYDCNEDDTSIYVLINSIPSSGSTVYVYYGNPSATNVEPKLGSESNPGISCKNIFEHRNDNEGNKDYYITPSGNLSDRIKVRCDMSNNGGGWTLVWHGLPSEAMVLNTSNESVSLSNDIVFNHMWIQGTNLNFGITSPTAETAKLNKSIPQYFYEVDQAPDTPSPRINFHDLDGNQDVLLSNNYFMFGYGNSWRVFYTCINVSSVDYLYIGGYTPTCIPRSSFVSEDVGCVSSHYCNNARNTTPKDSGLNLSLYEYQESEVYVKENEITLLANQSMGSIQPEEVGGGPIGYWKFDEGTGTTAYNSSSTNFYGAITTGTSSPTWSSEDQCISNKCLTFYGTNSYINIGTSLNYLFVDQNFTIQSWINPSRLNGADTTNYEIFGNESYNNYGILFRMNIHGTPGNLIFRTSQSGSVQQTTSKQITAVDTWYHVAAVRNGSSIRIYINGVDATLSAGNHTNPVLSSVTARISGGQSFNGKMDEVKIYPYARTADQIKQDYNSRGSSKGSSVNLGVKSNTAPSLKSKLAVYYKLDENNGTTIYDSSGNNLNGILSSGTSSPTWSTNGKFRNALSFDGNDSITLANEIVSTSLIRVNGITYSVWINPSITSGIQKIVGQKPSSGYSDFASGGIDISSGKARMIAYDDNIAYKYATGNTTLNPNQWYLITGIYDPSDQKIKIYVNGKFDGGETSITTFNRLLANNYNLVGSHNYSSSFFNGLVDEIKIYNRALTPEEILQDYNQGSAIQFGSTNQTIGGTTTSLEYCIPGDTSHCASPIAEWNFEENTGTIAKDTSGNGYDGTFVGSPTWSTGQNNKGAGIKLNGIGNYVRTNSLGITLPSDYTVQGWVKIDEFSADGDSNRAGLIGGIACNSSNSIEFNIGGGTSTDLPKIGIGRACDWSTLYSTGTFPFKKWTHITLVVESTGSTKTAIFYINGQNAGTRNVSAFNTDIKGQLSLGDNAFRRTIGTIDSIKIYDYVRTPAQIAYDYNKGGPIAHWKLDECQGLTAFDSSGSGYTGAINIGPSGSQTSVGTCQIGTSAAWTNGASGKINASLNFDGTDDYITIPTISFTDSQPWSFSSWIKHNNNSTTFYAGRNHAYEGFLNYNGGNIAYRDKNGTYHSFTSSGPYQNIFTNMIWIADGNNNLSLYINGQFVKTTTIPTQMSFQMFGRGYSSDGYNFKGQMDDVRVYNYALTSEQVKTVYNNGAINFR